MENNMRQETTSKASATHLNSLRVGSAGITKQQPTTPASSNSGHNNEDSNENNTNAGTMISNSIYAIVRDVVEDLCESVLQGVNEFNVGNPSTKDINEIATEHNSGEQITTSASSAAAALTSCDDAKPPQMNGKLDATDTGIPSASSDINCITKQTSEDFSAASTSSAGVVFDAPLPPETKPRLLVDRYGFLVPERRAVGAKASDFCTDDDADDECGPPSPLMHQRDLMEPDSKKDRRRRVRLENLKIAKWHTMLQQWPQWQRNKPVS
jgi:hypothetical protein